MNKFHVSLLALLCAVSGEKAAVEDLQKMEEAFYADKNYSKTGLILSKDALVYACTPDVVGRVARAVNYVTRGFIKNNAPAVPTIIANNMPNAVNTENANLLLIDGLIALCVSDKYDFVTEAGYGRLPVNIPLTMDNFMSKGGHAVNSMTDAACAITAVELLSYAGNKIVAKAGGERGEQFVADYAGWLEYAKVASYAVLKQMSTVYAPKVFATE